METLGKLAKWPADQIFPVLDIFRLLVLKSSTARLLATDAGALEPANEGLGGMIARGLSSSVPGSRMVALRLACNCLMQQNLRTWLLKHGSKLLDLVSDCSGTDTKPFRAALATTLLNLGVAVHLKDWENAEDVPVRILSLLQQVCVHTRARICYCGSRDIASHPQGGDAASQRMGMLQFIVLQFLLH